MSETAANWQQSDESITPFMIKEPLETKDFVSTVRFSHPSGFHNRARILDVPKMVQWGKYELKDEVGLVANILRAARTEKVLLLFSSRGLLKPDLLATAIMGLWPKRSRPRVVLYGEMFQPDTGIRGLLERCLIKLANRTIYRYVVCSTDELHLFPETWGVDHNKLRFCPLFLEGEREVDRMLKPRGTHLFAGGDSMRDYEPLIETAKRLPEHQFVFCTTRLQGHKNLPANIKIGPIQRQDYLEWMDTAAAVLIPIHQGLRRTAGIFTLLSAMYTKKRTIVSSAPGIQDYAPADSVRVVDGSPDSYVEAIQWVFSHENAVAVDKMCEAAHQFVATQLTREHHIDCLLDIMDEAIQGTEQSG